MRRNIYLEFEYKGGNYLLLDTCCEEIVVIFQRRKNEDGVLLLNDVINWFHIIEDTDEELIEDAKSFIDDYFESKGL